MDNRKASWYGSWLHETVSNSIHTQLASSLNFSTPYHKLDILCNFHAATFLNK